MRRRTFINESPILGACGAAVKRAGVRSPAEQEADQAAGAGAVGRAKPSQARKATLQEDALFLGEGLEAIFAAYPDETARFDLGCHSPLEHGMELAPVALDGELGRSYARRHETGGVYVAMVTERDAPTADEVRGEVVEFAIEKQGPEVFNQWAAELLIRAEVEVNDGIGSWEPAPGTGDLPTVVANTG